MTANAIVERGPHGGGISLRHSLMLRIVAALAASMMLVGAALFYGIDRFVSAQFARVREEQAARLAEQVRRIVAADVHRMEALAGLLASDADLNHATYYHLYLEGERIHPEAAIARLARAFDLDAVVLSDAEGRRIAVAAGSPDVRRTNGEAARRSAAMITWIGDRAWVVAQAPLVRQGEVIARLHLGQPLERIVRASGPGALATDMRESARPAPVAGNLRIALDATAARPIFLDLALPDTVGRAIGEVKDVLAVILSASGLALVVAIGLYLRWQLQPLRALAQEAAAVGRGEFGRPFRARGSNEISDLVDAFNAMKRDLAKLRAIERQLMHQQHLSSIGTVAARVAHDLNNPLTVISNVARLMQRRLAPADDLAEDVRLIVHHSERCVRTVENLLEYGRPVMLHAVPVELGRVCRDMIDRWRVRAQATRLRFVPGSAPVPVRADPLQIEQMLDNLLDNAREACEGGSITVEVGCDARRAFIRIEDEGPGFCAAAREHLFEPFFTTKANGTGLGTASCLAIAKAHGGGIEIDAGNRGRVTVWLPLPDQTAPEIAR